MANSKKPNGRKGTVNRSYKSYIHKLFKYKYANMGMSKKGMSTINAMTEDMLDRLAAEAAALVRMNRNKTMTHKHILTACRIALPTALADSVIKDVKTAVTKYDASYEASM